MTTSKKVDLFVKPVFIGVFTSLFMAGLTYITNGSINWERVLIMGLGFTVGWFIYELVKFFWTRRKATHTGILIPFLLFGMNACVPVENNEPQIQDNYTVSGYNQRMCYDGTCETFNMPGYSAWPDFYEGCYVESEGYANFTGDATGFMVVEIGANIECLDASHQKVYISEEFMALAGSYDWANEVLTLKATNGSTIPFKTRFFNNTMFLEFYGAENGWSMAIDIDLEPSECLDDNYGMKGKCYSDTDCQTLLLSCVPEQTCKDILQVQNQQGSWHDGVQCYNQ